MVGVSGTGEMRTVGAGRAGRAGAAVVAEGEDVEGGDAEGGTGGAGEGEEDKVWDDLLRGESLNY